MFYLINFIDFYKYYVNSEFDASILFQACWNSRLGKLWNALKHLFGTFRRWTGDSIEIGCERDILLNLRRLKGRMGKGERI